MANIVALKPPIRGHRLQIMMDGEISEEALDDALQDEIHGYRDCIDGAEATIRRALNDIATETRLIAIWETKIAELEGKRGQLSVIIDFPALAQRDENQSCDQTGS